MIAESQGVTPKALENRPVPIQGMDFYFDAYSQLQTERQIGMAVGDIPWGSIVKYAQFHGIENPDDIQDFITIIRAVERALSEFERGKNGK